MSTTFEHQNIFSFFSQIEYLTCRLVYLVLKLKIKGVNDIINFFYIRIHVPHSHVTMISKHCLPMRMGKTGPYFLHLYLHLYIKSSSLSMLISILKS